MDRVLVMPDCSLEGRRAALYVLRANNLAMCLWLHPRRDLLAGFYRFGARSL